MRSEIKPFLTMINLIILVVLLGANLSLAAPMTEKERELSDIMSKLLSSELSGGRELKHEETRDLLERLREPELANRMGIDEERIVKSLLRLRENLNETNCDRETFEFIANLLAGNDNRPGIVPYIKYYKYKHFELCKPILDEKLKEYVNSLKPEVKDSFKTVLEPYIEKDAQNSVARLASIVKQSGTVKKEDMKSKRQFSNALHSVFLDFCHDLNAPFMRDQRRIYEAVFYNYDEDEMKRNFALDMEKSNMPVTLTWVSYSRACHELIKYAYVYTDKLYEKLIKDASFTAKTKNLLHKLKI